MSDREKGLDEIQRLGQEYEMDEPTVMTNWQPIETAPKDGIFLGWVPTYFQGKGGHALVIWSQGEWWDDKGWTLTSVGTPVFTHWMPLPEPPQPLPPVANGCG